MFLVEMNQNNECDSKPTFDKYMKKYFPISTENANGVIPLLGAVTSCFAVGILMETFYGHGTWFGIWFFTGFLIYVVAQTFWGFHSKDQKFLQLWIACKGAEVLVPVINLAFGGLYIGILFPPSIFLLVLLVFLLCLGFVKNKNFKKSEKSILANLCLDQIYTTKY